MEEACAYLFAKAIFRTEFTLNAAACISPIFMVWYR